MQIYAEMLLRLDLNIFYLCVLIVRTGLLPLLRPVWSRKLSFSLSSTRRLPRNDENDALCSFLQMLTTRC